ncbi:MAG: cobalt-zinc-cadmium efflux system outer membrane protein [Pirellulaceae bacterium]
MSATSRLLKTCFTLSLALATGCVAPLHISTCQLNSSLLARTGVDLGPNESDCDLAFDDWVEFEDGLSEEEAISIGVWNNPAYRELLADLQITRADILIAAQLPNPRVSTMFPVGVKQFELALTVPLDALCLRPLRVSAAELESQRVAERLVQDGLNLVRDIRFAYIDWQLAAQRAKLSEEGAALRSEIGRIAEARLAAGDVAELDVSAIQLEALVGQGEVIRATHDLELARERLRYVLGLQLSDSPLEFSPISEPQVPDLDVQELVTEAVSSRPDLRAIQLAVDAAQSRAELVRRDIWQLAGILPDINGRGFKGFEAGPGLQINIPLFHQNQGEIAKARADAQRLQSQFVNRRDLAAMEVKRAHIQLTQAKKEVEIWRDQILPQAEKASSQSRAALGEDGVSPLLVLETTRQLIATQQRAAEANGQLRRAIAELERSVGRRLFTVAEAPHVKVLPPSVAVRRISP